MNTEELWIRLECIRLAHAWGARDPEELAKTAAMIRRMVDLAFESAS